MIMYVDAKGTSYLHLFLLDGSVIKLRVMGTGAMHDSGAREREQRDKLASVLRGMINGQENREKAN